MSYGGFLYDNAAYDVTPTADESATNYPITNGIDKDHATKHRSTTKRNLIKWNFVTPKALQGASIHNHNLIDGDVIEVWLGTDAPGSNLFLNGDGETWDGGSPTGWTKTEAGGTISQEAGIVKRGASSVKINSTGAGATYFYSTANIVLVSGAKYYLTFWYYCPVGKNAEFYIADSALNVFLHADGTFSAGTVYLTAPGTGAWARYTLLITAHAAYTNYRALFGKTVADIFAWYLDDWGFYRVDEVLNLEPSWAAVDLYYAFAATKTYQYVSLYLYRGTTYIEAGEYCLWKTKYQFSKDFGMPGWRKTYKVNRYLTNTCGIYRKTNLSFQMGFLLAWRQIVDADFTSMCAVIMETDVVYIPDYALFTCYHGTVLDDQLAADVGMDSKDAYSVTFWQSGIRA